MGLTAIAGARVLGPIDTHDRRGVVSFALEGFSAEDACRHLDDHGVALCGGHHCAQPFVCAFGGQIAIFNTSNWRRLQIDRRIRLLVNLDPRPRRLVISMNLLEPYLQRTRIAYFLDGNRTAPGDAHV